MDDLDLPRAPPVQPAEPAFNLRRALGAATPLVFASPHSGRLYPAELMAASVLSAKAIRRSEDALVDLLLEGADTLGVNMLMARFARAYLDVNREPYELDPAMFEDELPPFARGRTPKVAAGLGAIARVVAEGQEIYGRKLSFAEACERIEAVHKPYHAALSALLREVRADFGRVALVDWHSMPSAAGRSTSRGRTADFVLGDRFGASCTAPLTALVERELRAMGYEVARNAPYAGGYTTELYGDPLAAFHVLQVEINRALYLDEATLAPSAGFDRVRLNLRRLTAVLAERWREVI
ncbi:N-formylglutamate amidohydrolase [Caulobacter sp. S45]|uniref:N-formylglutamate amidohydrolase n=1 Tax=Caulobacter sp. S45 TaxID=1641861 RepID=UPI001575EF6D|nr:N-formylglutamate amidohydrolase [Caulobacter sp. S45]